MTPNSIAKRVRQSVKDLFSREEKHKPEWVGSIAGYTIRYLSQHAWRFRRECELDDLIQDAFVLFLESQEEYEGQSDREFMAFWKTVLHNWLINKANRLSARRRRDDVSIGDLDFPSGDDRISDLEWGWHLSEAPESVRSLLISVGRRSRRAKTRRDSGRRETTNAYLCRLAGVPATVPLRRIFDLWLSGNNQR